MKRIKRLISKQKRANQHKSYTLYTYEVEDDFGNTEQIEDLNEYKLGDRVETWFKGLYNKPGMRLYKEKRPRPKCDKCHGIIVRGEEVAHEYCNITKASA